MIPTYPLEGRRVLITGATSGLGRQLARWAAAGRAHVIIAGRAPERLALTRQELDRDFPHSPTETLLLDLASFENVRRAVSEAHDRWTSLDVLVNNAGVMAIDPGLGPDGHDLTMTVNHLSPTLLSVGLLNLLERGRSPRVTFTSSVMHWLSRSRPGLLGEPPSPPRRWVAYARSKEANLTTSLELSRRARDSHSPVAFLCAHPGVASTHLGQEGHGVSNWFMRAMAPRLLPSVEQGCRSLADAAFTDEYPAGSYVGPRAVLVGPSHLARPSSLARDPRHARETLDRTLALVGTQLVFGSTT